MPKECIETISGRGRLNLSDRLVELDFVIRVFQEYVEGIPTLRSASGGLKLPHGDVAFAMLDRKPLKLELQEGRSANILFTEVDGTFVVTGPIA